MLAGHVRNWLTRNGFPVRDFNVVPREGLASSGYASPGSVSFTGAVGDDLAAVAGRYGTRGRLNNRDVEALRVLMHEGLHQMQFGRNPEGYDGPNGQNGYWEEAATESVTQDLLPIFARQLYGDASLARRRGTAEQNSRDGETYAPGVMRLRQLSTFGSGAKNFRKRPARVWRRQFHHAAPEARQAMIDAATAKRVAWGQRTGR